MLRVAAGGRGDYVTTENVAGYFGDRETSNGAFSGFASATAGPFSGFTLTGQVARAFRDPTISDRYFRGPSGRGFITGNPDLEPETSLQYDVAARYALGRAQVAAYFYHYRIDDLIERYQTDPDFFFFRNRGRARLRGFEFEARAEAGKGFSVEGGVNIGEGEALDDGANLDDVSPRTVFLMARQDFGETKKGYAQLRAAFAADDDRPGPSEINAPGSTVIDLSGGWRFARQLELRGILRNLLDDEYLREPGPALRVRARPLGQPDARLPLLATEGSHSGTQKKHSSVGLLFPVFFCVLLWPALEFVHVAVVLVERRRKHVRAVVAADEIQIGDVGRIGGGDQ